MHPIELNVLGSFSATVAGRPPARFPTDKIRALLVYLAMEGDPPQRREILAGLFWPEQPESRARQNLRQSLYRLRRLLNGQQDHLGDELLTVSPKSIGINKQLCQLDAALFLDYIGVVDAHDHLPLAQCASCISHLESAVALYRDEFLSGLFLPDALRFDEWLATLGERYHHEMMRALAALADAHEQLANNEQAYQYAQQQISLEPWREAAHRQIMRLLVSNDERSKAIAQYELCARILQEEFGVEPAAETEALYAKIVAGEQINLLQKAAAPKMAHFPALAGLLIGRAQEIGQIVGLISQPECRLLTLAGLGGIGKTSLAVATAQELAQGTLFPDGLYFASVASVATPDLLISTIARALDLSLNNRRDHRLQVLDYLRGKACLLVIDNFEHLVDAAPSLAELIALAPGVKILVTSRELLNIKVEQRLLVTGLDYPLEATSENPGETVESYGALRLFVQEARRVLPDFELSSQNEANVIEICRLVHGIPLAISFAASWLRLMDTGKIAAEIVRNLDFLATSLRDVPPRHRSLRAVFQQSWQLLSESEKRALAQIAIFCGTFALDAVLKVTQATHSDLANLLDRSFLERAADNRYTCHELLRQFAAEKLAERPDNAERTATRHSRYYLEFMHRNEPLFFGPDSLHALTEMENELGNIDRAWNTAVRQQTWPLIEKSLDGVVYFYMLSGYYAQLARMLAQVQERIEKRDNRRLAGYLSSHQANVFIRQGHFTQATAALEGALAIACAEKDERLQARVNMSHGRLLELQGAYGEGLAALHEAHEYYDNAGNIVRLARIARLMGNLYWRQSYFDRAAPYYQESLALAMQSGDKIFQAVVLGDLGILYTDSSALAEAIDNLQQALQLDQELGNHEGVARHKHNMGRVYRLQENWSQAMAYFKQALQTAEELGLRRGVSVCLSNMGIVYWRTGRFEKAIDHYQRALAIDRDLGLKEGMSNNIGNLANVYRRMGRFKEAEEQYRQALQIAQEMGHQEGIARHLVNIAALHKDRREWETALEAYGRAITAYRKFDDPYSLSAALIDRAEVFLELGQYAEAAALNEEGLSLAEAVQRKDYTFRGRVLNAKQNFALGQAQEGRRQLQVLLAETHEAPDQAHLHDELWQMGTGEMHRLTAIELYKELIENTPDITYKNRLDALSSAPDGSEK